MELCIGKSGDREINWDWELSSIFVVFPLFKESTFFGRAELSEKEYTEGKILRTCISEDVFILFSNLIDNMVEYYV